ncbi:aspartate aminotransferase family protein [Halobacillus karajensis]|uniref:glutamate-1-semialdehyde 2,1-aminomutase n=1 Tax=Halobacillus karajensis TaxID=195088 RepID=A0A024PAQ6_9BACI|nr:aspartate aminotransferase family protein [Halobacillus karajensis]CDQ21790.1 Glutamate-1-semialdehyde 2,1-aminomutase [Halobacillus karajensis]CDQ25786.1 Glutamate-1-semialdehyde 2,1-aminomutase [Halobacillus karajensis]CDQ29787.1 Glutamate-1-semialdehyde 2,1-aminomutase [Halobacillus karajensis]
MGSEDFHSFAEQTKRSAEQYTKARELIPGGVTANIKYMEPHPIIMRRAEGSKLYDIDHNEYMDYLLSYGALIHGHGHPEVYEAVMKQMKSSGTTIFGTPHELEMVMAEKLISLYPGIEMVRYTNSGLEATLLALRTARAYTGKPKIAKFEGHYHGGYDQVLLSVNPEHEKSGDAAQPNSVPESHGLPEYYQKNTIMLPFNDFPSTEKILRTCKEDISAIIMEPVQGGFIPAEKEFIKQLRTLTEELGIVLILDEVKTGFRLSLGGAQEVYGIEPDITALGKVLGGGFPIGAIGGKKEIMNLLSPHGGRDIMTVGEEDSQKREAVFHSGTYNGHPTVLAAGLSTIELLERDGVIGELFSKTHALRDRLEELYGQYGIPMQTIGKGSIFNIILSKASIKNYRDMEQADLGLRKAIDYELLKNGVYTKPLNRYSLSTAHTEEDISRTIRAHEQAIKTVLKQR